MNIEEIKEGMYVKYTRGLINGYVPPRIAKITDCSDKDLIKIDNGQVILRNDILKTSKNIIGLIQTGDYVNDMKVTNYYYVGEQKVLCLNYAEPYEESKNIVSNLCIKSIVTKEQFDSMKYEVDSNE